MYPRVKVRQVEEVNHLSPSNDGRSLLCLQVLESLFSQNGSSTDENQSNSPPSIPRITKASKDVINNGKDMKPNSRVSGAVLRPRAVLSSPDNDGLIRNRYKFDNERSSSLKKANGSDQKSSAKTTATRSPSIKPRTEAVNAIKASKDSFDDRSSGLPQKKSSKALLQRQKEGNSKFQWE
ncbi:Atp-dependent rna helicase dbp-7 [Melia azedarach]|uniref:Atp-dependent rna helicase dbp-7 n=1 Tax=Melia azedarach TaxID=155640 RepID=A0ACC1YXX8_MELAZ|nr:Atp-dependent rna helicase dbp-7 [Melia azedarach]